jgi:nitrite reductase/ring-hydroxylating ferredoxin subunit
MADEVPQQTRPGDDEFFAEPPLIEPGGVIARAGELDIHPTKKFRLMIDQGFGPRPAEALLVLFKGEVRAFLNVCPHVGTPLDWMPNEFFDAESKRLLCRTHGALFDPLSGGCLAGPCAGKGLTEVSIVDDGEGAFRLP